MIIVVHNRTEPLNENREAPRQHWLYTISCNVSLRNVGQGNQCNQRKCAFANLFVIVLDD